MSDFEYHTDPRLGRNTAVVDPGDRDGLWVIEHGTNQDGDNGATVTNMEADTDDETITQLEYVFVRNTGVYAHAHTTIHRHGDNGHPDRGEGECEQVPPNERPAPDIAADIVIDALRVPVAAPNGDTRGATGEVRDE